MASAVRYLAIHVVNEGDSSCCSKRRESTAYVFQHYRLFPRAPGSATTTTSSTQLSRPSFCLLAQHCRIKSTALFMSFRTGSGEVGYRTPFSSMGASKAGRNLYRSLDQDRWERTQDGAGEREDGRMGQSQSHGWDRLETALASLVVSA